MLAAFFTETLRIGVPIGLTALGTVFGAGRSKKWAVVGAAAGWTVGYVGSRVLLSMLEGNGGKIPKNAIPTPPEAVAPMEKPKSVSETLKGMESKQQSVQPTVSKDNTVIQMPGTKNPKVGPAPGFGFDPGGSV